MKIRKGFVSNSSSSSFIIGVKDGSEMTADMLSKAMNVPESSPLNQFSKNLVEFIISRAKEVTTTQVENDYDEKIEELFDRGYPAPVLLLNGYRVYELYASYNESDNPIETFIGNGGLDDIDTVALAFRLGR